MLPARDLFAATKRWKRGSKWIRVQARFCLLFHPHLSCPYFSNLSLFPRSWKCCKLYNAGLCSTESSHMNSRPEHTQKHTDKLIILKKQRPGAHLAYFPRQRWDVGRGIEFRGGCSRTLGNIQYSKCDAHKHSLCIVNLRPHLPQITSPRVLDYSLWLCNWNPEKIMPKLKEANSRVGFQLSIPVGFYSIMTYSTPSVLLPVTRSRHECSLLTWTSLQLRPMALHGQQYSIINISLFTCSLTGMRDWARGVSQVTQHKGKLGKVRESNHS